MLVALVVSLAVNALGVAALAWRRRRKVPDYPAIAEAWFAPLGGGETVLLGDSHVGNAPLLEILTDYRQWAIGGQTVADVASWAERAGPAGRVVVSAGTNDLLTGRTPEDVERDYARLLDLLPQSVTILAVPPLRAHERVVCEVNDRLTRLAAERSARFVRWPAAESLDGVHFSQRGYQQVAATLRDAVR